MHSSATQIGLVGSLDSTVFLRECEPSDGEGDSFNQTRPVQATIGGDICSLQEMQM